MNYKHSCVIDSTGAYKTLVLVLCEPDEQGQAVVQHYTLAEGEQLIDALPPASRPYAGASGLIRPRWDGTAWVDTVTAEEIAAWELNNPAPPLAEPTSVERLQAENKLLKAQLTATTDRQDFMEDCMAEMAMQVYNV